MKLPIAPPVEPMLAKSVAKIPTAEGMSYEPKWDGFRCIIFRDGDEVELASRGGKTLTRYFPEVVEQAKAQLPERSVIDGEIVVIRRQEQEAPKLDFELLGQRIHPAASRVNMLAEKTPASFIAFDLLALGDEDLMEKPFAERREKLEEALKNVKAPVHVTPVSTDPEVGQHWFELFEGAGLDGIIAKPADILYEPDKRLMFKIKHSRTADAVVAGFRWHKSGPIDRVAAARPVRRRGQPAPRRRLRELPDGTPQRSWSTSWRPTARTPPRPTPGSGATPRWARPSTRSRQAKK